MPGMIGIAGSDISAGADLLSLFSDVWAGSGRVDTLESPKGLVAGHSFTSSAAVSRLADGTMIAVDGEASLYGPPGEGGKWELALFDRNDEGITLTPACKGNLAVFDGSDGREGGRVYLAAESSGLFPLYYSHQGDTLLFSSHIRPLARTVGAEVDPVGVCEFIRFRHIYHDRSLYRGIKRLLPGQVLALDLESNLVTIRETAGTWTRRFDESDQEEIFESYIAALNNATARCLDSNAMTGLMMSGGWDSKVLLASMLDILGPGRIFGYTHGGVKGRELKIAGRIMADSGISYHLENIDERTFHLDSIEEDFYRSENVVFPHWMRAGRLLKEVGVSSVAAGIFGEVGGGHYTAAWTMPRWKQGLNVGMHLLRLDQVMPGAMKGQALDMAAVYDRFTLRNIDKPRTVGVDFWNSVPDLVDQVNADVHSHLRRLESRGIEHPDQLVEAILTETRGSQYIGAQLRICRCSLNVANIYGDMEHLDVSSWIPPAAKVHNLIGKETLRRTAPWLLRYPTAATVIPNRYPMIMQEVARVARRGYETGAMKLRLKTKGRVSPRLVAWHDFEFMRDGRIFREIAGTLRAGIFDADTCSGFIDDVERYVYPYELYNVQNDMMTAYTVDRILA